MRRKDREVTDPAEIDRVIRACACCRIGLNAPEGAYIVPLSFGFSHEGGVRVFHFHGARDGRKMDLMAQSPAAGFEMDTGYGLRLSGDACECSAGFKSVIGTGVLSVVEDRAEKARSLDLLMEQAGGKGTGEYPDAMLARTAVFRLTVKDVSCKFHP
ncbi:MAG TPA: pyridoxamine 5'-phosphate oxidase family protein [Candidatus Limnocylindria bacterium]|nr:pyridoxamine 5'-phosphate oxidase family protein [Candidatus Limnocylindria bacterium]